MNSYNVKFSGSFICIWAIVIAITLIFFLFSRVLNHENKYFFSNLAGIFFFPLHKGNKNSLI